MTTGERRYLIHMPKVACTVCGKMVHRPPSHLKRVQRPTCSRQCNGVLRGQEWAKHGHRGAKARTTESYRRAAEKMRGKRNPAWRGGSYVEPKKGYRMLRIPDHPRARANGYVLEHLVVAEQMLGRRLEPGEEVHHKDRDKLNNHPSNLQIYSSHQEHWVTEHLEDVQAARDAAASRKHIGDSAQP